MALQNYRWPDTLCPQSCDFGRSRNDVLQESPRTRQRTVIRRGRPLWSAKLAWRMPNNHRLAQLRLLLEQLDGHAGSVQIWNFAAPEPQIPPLGEFEGYDRSRLATGLTLKSDWAHGGSDYKWTFGGSEFQWTYDQPIRIEPAPAGTTTVTFHDLEPDRVASVCGMYVQIGRRLYLSERNQVSDANGDLTIEIRPGLLEDVDENTEVRLVNAACEMTLSEQSFVETASAENGFAVIRASFIETVTDYE